MKKIIKWLDDNNIDYVLASEGTSEYITIILETDCIWINGFGEEMKYDKKINIHYNKQLGYGVYEQYMYSRTKTLVSTKRYKDVVDTLKLKLLN